MASLCSKIMVVMVATVAAAMLLTGAGAQTCLGQSMADPLPVYPSLLSWCWEPAVYYTYRQEVYELAAVGGYLAPEYDETNSTYYMRLADVGAKYVLASKEFRFIVKQSDDVMFVNKDTGRALGWRQEGQDEFFLVETESLADFVPFQFAFADWLPCIKHVNARCETYHILTFGNSSSRGLSPYVEDGVTYLKQGTDTGLSFALLRTSKSVLAAPA